MSRGIIVTRLACIAAILAASNNSTRNASAASCRALRAELWKRRPGKYCQGSGSEPDHQIDGLDEPLALGQFHERGVGTGACG